MIIDDAIRDHLIAIFEPLNNRAAANSFPPPMSLSKSLEKLIPKDNRKSRNVDLNVATCFSTAAVDMWLRSVHSLLVSASLTVASPIWASVVGYYSSHYTVRGLAHLLGHFQLYRNKQIVDLKMENRRFVCSFRTKKAGEAEHKLYWKLVKQSHHFREDIFFTENNPENEDSDVRHRNHANYSDHLSAYPIFKPLNEGDTKHRIEYISKIRFDAPPLPRFSKFPDVEYVQVIAYHRIVRFRRLLDEILGGRNRFWNVHRNPSFSIGYIDFQLVEADAIAPLVS